MYSRSAWGGDTDPFILTKFMQNTPEGDEDPVVSLVIFEWKDEELVGVWPSEDAAKVRAWSLQEDCAKTRGFLENVHLRRWQRDSESMQTRTARRIHFEP